MVMRLTKGEWLMPVVDLNEMYDGPPLGPEGLAETVLRVAVQDALTPPARRTSFWQPAAGWLSLPDAPTGPVFWCDVAGLNPRLFYSRLAAALSGPRHAWLIGKVRRILAVLNDDELAAA